MRPHTFSLGHHDLIDAILDDRRASVTVACSVDDVDQVFGWVCWEGLTLPGEEAGSAEGHAVLHYVLVKQSPNYQRFGIGRALVEYVLAKTGGPLCVSHMTETGQRILDAHPRLKVDYRFAYSPYAAFMPKVRVQW